MGTAVVTNIRVKDDGSVTASFSASKAAPEPDGQGWQGCTCALLPTAGGEEHPVNWVLMQREVEVVLTSGEVYIGEPCSVVPSPSSQGEDAWDLYVMPWGEGDEVFLPLTEIATVTPLRPTTAQDVLSQVATALGRHGLAATEEPLSFDVPVGPESKHEHVIITVERRVRDRTCAPPNAVVPAGPET